MKKVSDKLTKTLVLLCAVGVSALFLAMVVFIVGQSLPALASEGAALFSLDGEWRPTSAQTRYSLMPAICGTLYVSAIAMVLSMLFGVGAALYLNFYAPRSVKTTALTFIDMMAGVPSVIFGFVGLVVVARWFVRHLQMSAGQCVLAAGIVLGIMLLPYVVSACSESVELVRKKYGPTASALGISREEQLLSIVLPSIKGGVLSAAVMAFGRGLGETMAVMMVIGNSAIYPHLLGRGQTIPALTALEMGSVEYGSIHLSALYVANLVLLLLLAVVFLVAYLCKRGLTRHEK